MSTSTEQLRIRMEWIEKQSRKQDLEIQRLYETTANAHGRCKTLEQWQERHDQACAFPKRRWWQFWK